MNPWLKRAAIAVAVLVTLAFLWLGLQWIGPRAIMPAVDPLQTYLTQASAEATRTAAEYADAFARFARQPIDDWDEIGVRYESDVPAVLAEWVRDNEPYARAMCAVARHPECAFGIGRSRDGGTLPLMPELSELRRAARFLMLRAKAGLERGSAAETVEAVAAIDGMARHICGYPVTLTHFHSIALRSLQTQVVLWPYTLPDWPCEERMAYARTVRTLLAPPRPPEEILRGEREEICWMLRVLVTGKPIPLSRIAGEVDRRLKPLMELAKLPLHEQFHFGSADRLRFEAAMRRPNRSLVRQVVNSPGYLSDILVPSLERALSLNLRAVAELRGRLTVIAIFEYLDTYGELPESLAVLADPCTVDPFVGAPFIYRRTPDGFTIYSVGYDRDDDGGQHHARFGELSQKEVLQLRVLPLPGQTQAYAGDFVFWPIPIDVWWDRR